MTKNCLAVAGLALLPALASAEEVRVYNWSDYIDESILEQFEQETGIKVIYDVFDTNETLETKMLTGGSGYDVVVPTHNFLSRQIQAGVFAKLDQSLLPNRENLWEDIKQRVEQFDPGNSYSVNYMWGTTGIATVSELVDARMEDAPIDSWSILFNPEIAAKFQDCGIHVLDDPTEIIPAALIYLGHDGNSRDPKHLAEAEELLLQMRPFVQKFHSSNYVTAIADGDICVAVGYSGDVLQARDTADEADNGVTVQYRVPVEGSQMWFDQMAIPADAPNKEGAHRFINFIMRPEIAAAATNYVYYANGNKASQPLLEEDVITDPAIYPTEETVANLFVHKPYDAKTLRRVNRIWTRVKTGQ
ncbi:polyamine ABC transporter substrate-binding protein [Kiloniella sp. b19]|uniref:polyamine ABC transporter substrate-binding protein n=1 Tax=Kiloniella sp. GXU_MW_B19 TaxID=3141326 RepID=UPI0031D26B13